MGRRNASTFKKRQREVAKKEKKQAKILNRKARKGGEDDVPPDTEPTFDPLKPRVREAAAPPAIIRLSDLTLPSSDSDD